MKNKLFLAFAAVLFAAITLFNVNLAQQQAAGDITLAGVEMVAGAFDGIEPPEYGISCHQHALIGRTNVCWKKHRDWGSRPITDWCWFTGWMSDLCVM